MIDMECNCTVTKSFVSNRASFQRRDYDCQKPRDAQCTSIVLINSLGAMLCVDLHGSCWPVGLRGSNASQRLEEHPSKDRQHTALAQCGDLVCIGLSSFRVLSLGSQFLIEIVNNSCFFFVAYFLKQSFIDVEERHTIGKYCCVLYAGAQHMRQWLFWLHWRARKCLTNQCSPRGSPSSMQLFEPLLTEGAFGVLCGLDSLPPRGNCLHGTQGQGIPPECAWTNLMQCWRRTWSWIGARRWKTSPAIHVNGWCLGYLRAMKISQLVIQLPCQPIYHYIYYIFHWFFSN